ncbi:hypothetical protein PCANC_17022 [Puccinia coronata f. sp. avenae]|uniref:Uncharacterized protein n=1 Tax=Puccinia coronata f. sp. avenae TaxID=200324 RepID=A0A2N5SG66_9BASI|nr:hypothetical protein PCANC_17022 [Puccinia coronata f. sp. avenae]
MNPLDKNTRLRVRATALFADLRKYHNRTLVPLQAVWTFCFVVDQWQSLALPSLPLTVLCSRINSSRGSYHLNEGIIRGSTNTPHGSLTVVNQRSVQVQPLKLYAHIRKGQLFNS